MVPDETDICFFFFFRAHLSFFSSLEECARLTLPCLCKHAVALSGGSTYASLFNQWIKLRPPCTRTLFFPVDERKVPFEDPQSNWGTATRTFLDPLGLPAQKEHWPHSAGAYEHMLRSRFDPAPVVFDAVFLGAGDDGHTASLFPGDLALDDTASLVLETKSPKPPVDRITLGPAPLIAAQEAVVIIYGRNKATIVQRLREKDKTMPLINILSRRPFSRVLIERKLW